MARNHMLLWTCLIVFVAAFLIPGLGADPIKKAAQVTFADPVEIPGMVLEPGVYVIKVPDPVTHRDMVGFYNRDESHLYKLVRTIPRYRLEVTAKTVITYEERGNGAPPAVKTWFNPGEPWGKEFVYEKPVALWTADTLPLSPEEPEVIAEATPRPTPEVAPQPPAEPVAEEVAVAGETTPAPLTFPGETPFTGFEALPKTATPLPLVALAGGGSVVLGGVLRHRTRRQHSR